MKISHKTNKKGPLKCQQTSLILKLIKYYKIKDKFSSIKHKTKRKKLKKKKREQMYKAKD